MVVNFCIAEIDMIPETEEEYFYKRPSPPPIPESARARPKKHVDYNHQSNLLCADIVTSTLSDPDADPFIRDIFREHFTHTTPEPALMPVEMMPFPKSESGLSHLDHYPTAGIQYMVHKLAAEIKERPFPNAGLYKVKLEMEEEARVYAETPRPLSSRISRYRIAASGTYKTEDIQGMLRGIARENR